MVAYVSNMVREVQVRVVDTAEDFKHFSRHGVGVCSRWIILEVLDVLWSMFPVAMAPRQSRPKTSTGEVREGCV